MVDNCRGCKSRRIAGFEARVVGLLPVFHHPTRQLPLSFGPGLRTLGWVLSSE
jgi:hypothetical protein